MPDTLVPVTLRRPYVDENPAVACIWREGWREAHLGQVPQALIEARAASSFDERARALAGATTVAIVAGAVAGLVIIQDDEVQQLYVDPSHRGTDVAAALLVDAERQIAQGGHRRAWLAVVAGNTRARRFYLRNGWVDDGPFDHHAPGPDGPIPVPAHRHSKLIG